MAPLLAQAGLSSPASATQRRRVKQQFVEPGLQLILADLSAGPANHLRYGGPRIASVLSAT
jgi:hypothetical protein